MFVELLKIFGFIAERIIHVWPYLLISVPLAVAVRMSGASKYIGKVFNKRPMLSILLATIVGAFSPFCSCNVIPIIASLLIGGVPLAPVMSFWLASPSMDPEIFFLSVSVLGWQLAVWRLASAFGMSYISGLITHYLVKKGWVTNEDTLRAHSYSPVRNNMQIIKESIIRLKEKYVAIENSILYAAENTAIITANDISVNSLRNCDSYELNTGKKETGEVEKCGCAGSLSSVNLTPKILVDAKNINCCNNNIEQPAKNKTEKCGYNDTLFSEKLESGCCTDAKNSVKRNFKKELLKETTTATFMVVKFMVLAYFLEALIVLYLPGQFITAILGQNPVFSIIIAALIGVPVYTSSLPALALVAGLISKGMIPAAGLAFLISGPTTTIPAMAAVWNLANRKVFFLYVGFTLAFAILSGLLFYAASLLI